MVFAFLEQRLKGRKKKGGLHRRKHSECGKGRHLKAHLNQNNTPLPELL